MFKADNITLSVYCWNCESPRGRGFCNAFVTMFYYFVTNYLPLRLYFHILWYKIDVQCMKDRGKNKKSNFIFFILRNTYF